jgi:RNA polymerase sigma factor for flagellar operon FliA
MITNYSKTAAPDSGQRLDPAVREELIVKHAPLVKRIAAKMASRLPSSVIFDELISAGCLGLIDAIDKFDPERDVSLETYAEFRIRGAILDELRSLDWYSRSMRKKIRDIEKAVAAVEAREGRLAEDWEVAEELGMDLEKYFKQLSNIHGTALLSMDEYIKNRDNQTSSQKTFQEKLKSRDDPSRLLFREELKKEVARAIRTLSEKEQLVISLYYQDELTLNEIGNILKLTESRICQIHTSALIKLKNKLRLYYQD